jgi:protein Mpv17
MYVTQVAANQLILAPITLTTVFGFNLALTGKAELIGDKLKNDLWPTMQNGARGGWGGRGARRVAL